jgi:hypothetical protein
VAQSVSSDTVDKFITEYLNSPLKSQPKDDAFAQMLNEYNESTLGAAGARDVDGKTGGPADFTPAAGILRTTSAWAALTAVSPATKTASYSAFAEAMLATGQPTLAAKAYADAYKISADSATVPPKIDVILDNYSEAKFKQTRSATQYYNAEAGRRLFRASPGQPLPPLG